MLNNQKQNPTFEVGDRVCYSRGGASTLIGQEGVIVAIKVIRVNPKMHTTIALVKLDHGDHQRDLMIENLEKL